MKVAIITDTHYGARKGSTHLHDYFKLFYDNVFFPTLEKEGIDTVIHMGDIFDSRKSIDYQSLEWSKKVVFDPLRKYKVYAITGNHDCYYKNTNYVNSPELLLNDYSNISTFSKPTEINVGGIGILLLPWINSENQEMSHALIKKSRSPICMGHLELIGFRVHRGYIMEHGTDASIFNKFDKVFSGHYHTRSDNGKIFYLGNPYEIYWNDCNDTRGFHLFETETQELTAVDNPYRIFHVIYYEDHDHQLFDARQLKNKIVKVVVKKKSDQVKFEKFIDKLYAANVAELKIVENFALQESAEFEAFESEDTLSILNRYIEEAEIDLDRSKVQKLIQEVYQEACELV